MKSIITLALVALVVLCCSAWTERIDAAPCSEVIPFPPGNPWRALSVTSDELVDTLWQVDLDPSLSLEAVTSSQVGCFVVIWRGSTE